MWAAAIPMAIGALQAFGAGRELSKLQKEPQDFLEETPEMRASRMRAEALAKKGFTSEEAAAFMNNASSLANQRFRTATTTAGGNLAGSINAGINYGNIRGFLDFASADASMRRSNIRYADSFSGTLQRMADANVQRKQYIRDRSEQALGTAVQAGINNIAAGGMMMAMSGGGGGGNRTTTPTTTQTGQPTFAAPQNTGFQNDGFMKGALGKFIFGPQGQSSVLDSGDGSFNVDGGYSNWTDMPKVRYGSPSGKTPQPQKPFSRASGMVNNSFDMFGVDNGFAGSWMDPQKVRYSSF
jgi:hypothetical protein